MSNSDDILFILNNQQFVSNYIKAHNRSLEVYNENFEKMKKQNIQFINEFDLALTQDDFSVLIKRLNHRINGLKKMKGDYDTDNTKASPYKLYFLWSIAEQEHWYKTSVDSEASIYDAQIHLNKIASNINSLDLEPDDDKWSELRKKLPELFYDVITSVEQARNCLNYHLEMDISYNNKQHWIFSRVCELYDTVQFDHDNEPFSEPILDSFDLHPTDTFIKRNIPKEEWSERISHKNILLEYIDEIRKMAEMRTSRHEKIQDKIKNGKKNSQKPAFKI